MKKRHTNRCFTGLVLLGALVLAVNATAAPSDKAAEAARAVEQLRRAMIDGDTVALSSLTSPLLSYGHSGGKVEDKAAFLHAFATGASVFTALELTNQTVSVSGNTAVVRHTLSAATNDHGKPGNVYLGVLLIWQKQRGAWQLIARQAVKLSR